LKVFSSILEVEEKFNTDKHGEVLSYRKKKDNLLLEYDYIMKILVFMVVCTVVNIRRQLSLSIFLILLAVLGF
jgi:predicted nucleic acid-binding Zn ribbon protein